MKKNERLRQMIDYAKELGLNEKDILFAIETLEVNEYGLSFDHVTEQLCEYDTPITSEFYNLVSEVACEFKFDETRYSILKGLIKE